MDLSSKNKRLTVLAGLIGIFFLTSAYSNQPTVRSIRTLLIHWASLVAAVLLFIAIINFVSARIRGIKDHTGSFIFNLISLIIFLIVFFYGFSDQTDASSVQSTVFMIQSSVESVMTGLICLVMIYGIYRVARSQRSLLKDSFLFSAIFFLILYSGFFSFLNLPTFLSNIIDFIRILPTGGLYGLLIGIAIGALVTGIRVLFFGDHPYQGHKS